MKKAKAAEPKQRWVPIADPVEIADLKKTGKWKPETPLWREVDGAMWAESGDLKIWRAARISTGKRL